MKIAIFSDSYLPQVNGIASSLGLLNEQFLEWGHQVTVFTSKVKEANDDSENIVRLRSIQVRQNPPYYISSPISLHTLIRLKSEKVDVIHVHTPLTMGLLAYQAAKLLQKPLIYTYHTMLSEYLHYLGWVSKTNLAGKMARYFDLCSCNGCDLVIAPSTKIKNFLEERGIFITIEVVPNGIRLERFRGVNKGYLRARPDVKETDKILLFVGRLGAEKNPAFLIRALAKTLPKTEGGKLVFAGSGYLLPRLKQLAVELQISSDVIFLGDVPFDDMPALYADADIFVSAATTEVHPMALLEAIASGIPVVAVHDQAFESAVVHGQNGFLTILDEQAFVDRLVEVLQDPTVRQNMSEESLRISRQFSIETQANRLLDIYASMSSNPAAFANASRQSLN